MLALVVSILVGAAVDQWRRQRHRRVHRPQAWLYVSILGGAYFISRGLAKSGSDQPYDEDSDETR